MKILIVLFLGFVSCHSTHNTNSKVRAKISNSKSLSSIGKLDTAKVKVDDYNISNEMIADYYASNPNYQSEQIIFISNDETEVVHIYLATDYYRANITHYSLSDSAFLTPFPEFKDVHEFIKTDTLNRFHISKKLLQTKKGISLGDSKTHILKIYNEMDSVEIIGDIEILQWDYFGEELLEYEENTKNLRIARNSLGHFAKLFFLNDRLIGIMFENLVP